MKYAVQYETEYHKYSDGFSNMEPIYICYVVIVAIIVMYYCACRKREIHFFYVECLPTIKKNPILENITRVREGFN